MMGANISHRSGKCLKHRRAKSEEHLSSKHNLKHSMGKIFNPWNNILSVGGCTDDQNVVINCNNNNNNNNMTDSFSDNGYYRQWMDAEMSLMTIQKSINRGQTIKKSASFKKSHSVHCEDAAEFANEDFLKLYDRSLEKILPEITKDSIFEVSMNKGSRGLGFSIMQYEGLILIKQLFPLEAASQCGLLKERDIILSANGNSLTGLSSFEALRILRTLENPVNLIICRLQHLALSVELESSQIANNKYNTYRFSTNNVCDKYKEFEVHLKKVAGSLGFTLRKEGNGECSHLIRALVKEPAISDGRIKPGDKIISVNDTDIGMMSHQEAVKFLRDCDIEVKLKLRRSISSSSLASIDTASQHETNSKTLRKEALEMLNDLAVKKSSRKQKSNSYENHLDKLEHKLTENNRIPKLDERKSAYALDNNLALSNNLGEIGDEPVSLPALDVTKDKQPFLHNDPTYHSMNITNFKTKDEPDDVYLPNGNLNLANALPVEKNSGLHKWKGIVLDVDDSEKEFHCDKTKTHQLSVLSIEQPQLITVELQRSWNSRLGFSLHSHGNFTIISRIHEDSIASKDGRLQPNDRLIKINGNDVEHVETNKIIEMLRNVRGSVAITVLRSSAIKSSDS